MQPPGPENAAGCGFGRSGRHHMRQRKAARTPAALQVHWTLFSGPGLGIKSPSGTAQRAPRLARDENFRVRYGVSSGPGAPGGT